MLCFTCWKFRGNDFKSWVVFSFMPQNFIHSCWHSYSSYWSRTTSYLHRVCTQIYHNYKVRNGMKTFMLVLMPIIPIHMVLESDIIHWTWSWTTCSRRLCFNSGLGQEDLQRSLPKSTILWSLPSPKNQSLVLTLVWLKVAKLLYQIHLCSISLTNCEDVDF